MTMLLRGCPTDASEGEEGQDAGVFDLYLKRFQLQDNPLGLAHFSRGEEVLIELAIAAPEGAPLSTKSV
jgi:hypothetical protein